MKRSEPKILGDIIRESLRRDGIENRFDEQRAAYMWGDVVGPGVNRYTTRRFVESGVLHVYLSSASLKQELSFMKAEIIAAINKAVGSDTVKSLQLH